MMEAIMIQNSTDENLLDYEHQHILENPVVRVILFLIYSVVFFFCFFGNLAVVLVLTLHWRMRGVTKFCLGNLAFANLCVGIFCVYQNLFQYLMESWIFGNFLCKLYHFTNSLSHTASILILVVICVERYLVILHPFKCRRSLTMQRLRILMSLVWIVSAVLCSPRLYYINTIRVSLSETRNALEVGTESGTGAETGQHLKQDYDDPEETYEVICVAQQNLYDSHSADIIYFVLLFALPLLVISILYTKIALFLKKNDILSTGMYPKGMNRGKRFYLNPNLSESETTRSEPEQSITERSNYSYRIKNSITNLNSVSTCTRKIKSKSSPSLLLSSTYLQMAAKFHKSGKSKTQSSPLGGGSPSICSVSVGTCLGVVPEMGTGTRVENSQAAENIEMNILSCSSSRQNSATGLLPATESCSNLRMNQISEIEPKLQLTFSNNFVEDKIGKSTATSNQYPHSSTNVTSDSRFIFRKKKCHFQNRNKKILKENQNQKQKEKMQLKTLMKSKSYQRWKWQQYRQANFDKKGRVKGSQQCGRNWRQFTSQPFCMDREVMNTNAILNSKFEPHDSDNFEQNKTILTKASSLLYCCCECAFPSQNNNSTLSNGNFCSNEFICHMNNMRSSSISPIPVTVESSHRSERSLSCGGKITSSTSGSGTGTGIGVGLGSGSMSSQKKCSRRLNRIRSFHPRPRQAVVRMLIIIVATFALCNLPFHLRKLCQNHLPDSYFDSDISDIMTPVTFLLMYTNCAINPILYAFIFKSFRSSFKDLVTCRWRRTRYLK